jgi:hypothetical protein
VAEPNFSGTWKNQRKSILRLTVKNGAVSGTFESAVGDGGMVVVDVQGRTLGDRITFNATYPQLGTLVSWVGQLGPASDRESASTNDRMETVWLHASDIPEEHEQDALWSGIRTGGDVFTRER